ncbi:hypothetical protein T265_07159 [Opisthorchis viverrini]|uniref:Uncharacterized protein n=1 Tax=Opisthorchis viverrini TaxID=6198 RepID=A0A074ZDI0_OPIVI|nr:hypothetical protein T265_07159 [Opisthorchis viverrini]KER25356.1 hypothetical protein T265_07159 [Opisthorchis viverrini]
MASACYQRGDYKTGAWSPETSSTTYYGWRKPRGGQRMTLQKGVKEITKNLVYTSVGRCYKPDTTKSSCHLIGHHREDIARANFFAWKKKKSTTGENPWRDVGGLTSSMRRGEIAQVVRARIYRPEGPWLKQPGSIPALVLPPGGMAARHRKGATAEQFYAKWMKGRHPTSSAPDTGNSIPRMFRFHAKNITSRIVIGISEDKIKNNRSAVAPIRCLAAMPPEGSTRAGILTGRLDRGSREAKVGLKRRIFRSVL